MVCVCARVHSEQITARGTAPALSPPDATGGTLGNTAACRRRRLLHPDCVFSLNSKMDFGKQSSAALACVSFK